MRIQSLLFGFTGGVVAYLAASSATAAPTLRVQVEQRGDFKIIGNTLAHDCRNGVPAPVVGTVGACGTNLTDSGADVFWKTDGTAPNTLANNTVTVAQTSSAALLTLPTGATVTHAYLLWGAYHGATATPDLAVTLSRSGSGAFSTAVTATAANSKNAVWNGSNYYQSVADVTALVQQRGVGVYQLSGVEIGALVDQTLEVAYGGWSMVVLYRLDTDPPRSLALFDGLDRVENGAPQNATISGFLVPNSGFKAKLGVVTYEGDFDGVGDSFYFGKAPLGNTDRLSDALNPVDNFFNGTHSELGVAVSTAGDLPQTTGASGSMSSFDLDVVDITSRVTAGQTSADIRATSNGDVYFLGALATSISTYRPDFSTSTKTVSDVNGGLLVPGDTLEYLVNVVNTGNDASVGTVLADPLPASVSYVPGSLSVVSGPNTGVKTDATDTDQGEYVAGTRTIIVRLGTGANGTQGGQLPIGGTSVVRFRVTVNANATGIISNQAEISSLGLLGAPLSNTVTDGNGVTPGSPPTTVGIDECGIDADCKTAAKPLCKTAADPNVCVACLTNAQCSGNKPLCDSTGVCVACKSDSECATPNPACLPSGACGQCSATQTAECKGTTPVCLVSSNICVSCLTNDNCSGITPTCDVGTHLCKACASNTDCTVPNLGQCLGTGACGQCKDNSQCSGATPFCEVTSATCVPCLANKDCPITTPACSVATHTCGKCATDADCPTDNPACLPSGACGQCSTTNKTKCVAPAPVCDVSVATCVGCLTNTDCGGLTPTCNASHVCACVSLGVEVCGNGIDEDCDGKLDNGCLDTDSDGLGDVLETSLGTNPNDADSDDDGVLDGAEIQPGVDTDGDGLINALDPDSDDDGLADGTELGLDCSNPATDAKKLFCRADADKGATKTDPLKADTDNGGTSDGSEDANLNGMVDTGETDPTSGHESDDSTSLDTDKDGLSDNLEKFLGSDPADADTDDDGVPDGKEPNPSLDMDHDGLIDVLDVDSDNDGLFDGTELGFDCEATATDKTKNHCRADADKGATKTSALLKDTDKGGVMDGSEDSNLNGMVDVGETDPVVGHGADDATAVDSDGDGLSDALEKTLGSDPKDADSDNDGLLDGEEPNPSDDRDADGLNDVMDADSDGDGLFDGTEAGKDCANAATDAAAKKCTADADKGATRTGVLQPDTDKGGMKDGDEDLNHNGSVDSGERDPNNPADDTTCTTDTQCGSATSGKVCSSAKCVDGCRGLGGNGCPSGQTCSSKTATIGQCKVDTDGGTDASDAGDGAAGTGGTGGSGGSGGKAGAGGSGGTAGTAGSAGSAGKAGAAGSGGKDAGTDASADATDDTGSVEGGGCGCTTAGRNTNPSFFALILGAALAALGLRRRDNKRS